MTDSDFSSAPSFTDCDGNQKMDFDKDWNIVASKGINCHGCLKIDWESSTSRCVRQFIHHSLGLDTLFTYLHAIVLNHHKSLSPSTNGTFLFCLPQIACMEEYPVTSTMPMM